MRGMRSQRLPQLTVAIVCCRFYTNRMPQSHHQLMRCGDNYLPSARPHEWVCDESLVEVIAVPLRVRVS
jgi:hypothetical protein